MNNYKYTVMTLGLIILAAIMLFFSFSNNTKIAALSEGDYINPSREQMTKTVNLYFVFNEKLRPEKRTINFSKERSLEKSVMDALSAGPKNRQYRSIFEDDIMVLSVAVIDNICYIDVSEALLMDEFDQLKNKELYLWSIVNTMTELEGIEGVKITINGKVVDYPINDSNLNQPLYKEEDFIYKKKESAKTTVVEFLSFIDASRLDLSYELLSIETKEKYSFSEFEEYVNLLNDETAGYQTSLFITNEEDAKTIVSVKYNISDEYIQDVVNSFYKEWTVVKENGKYYIVLPYRV